MRITCLVLWLFLCAGPAGAQTFKPVWSVGVNPFSVGESLSSLGPSVALRVSPGIELWSEGSFIFHNLYDIAGWDHVKGYRFIFQPRLFMGTTRRFFLAPELRIKSFSYGISLPFINESAQDTLDGYYHRANQFQIGGALVMGIRTVLSEKHRLFMDMTAGIGGRQRFIRRKGIPAGYSFTPTTGGWGLAPHYEWHMDGILYLPIGLRLTWLLSEPD